MSVVMRRILHAISRRARRMLRPILRVALALAVLTAPALAHAGGCGYVSRSYYAPTYYEPYVERVVKKIQVLELLYVPVYAVGYAAPAPAVPLAAAPAPVSAAPAMTCDTKVSALEVRLAQSEARYAALEARLTSGAPQHPAPMAPTPGAASSPAPAAAPSAAQPKSVLLNRCAVCHDAGVAVAKGKNHVFFNAGKLAMNDAQVGAAMRMMNAGKMPPAPDKLSDADFSAAVNELLAASAGK